MCNERINYVISEGFYIGSAVNLPFTVQADTFEQMKKGVREIAAAYLSDLTKRLSQDEPFEFVEVETFDAALQPSTLPLIDTKDLQDQVREHINNDKLFDWREALTEVEMVFLQNLLLTFNPLCPPGSIGFEEQKRHIQSVPLIEKGEQSDAVEFAHKIGVAILKHSFEVIDVSLRKSVVEVGEIVKEFDKEGIDIIEHPNF